MWKRLIQNNYKIFFISIFAWFTLILVWEYLEKNYRIPSKYVGKLSQEFILTTGLGLVTTILTSVYNYQKKKTDQNLEEIKKNRSLFEANKDVALEAVRRLEDLIDQQIFELRRLDDFNNNLAELRNNQGLTDVKINNLHIVLERQKEQIKRNDKLISLTAFLLEDIKQREVLKLQMQEIINKLESKQSE